MLCSSGISEVGALWLVTGCICHSVVVRIDHDYDLLYSAMYVVIQISQSKVSDMAISRTADALPLYLSLSLLNVSSNYC